MRAKVIFLVLLAAFLVGCKNFSILSPTSSGQIPGPTPRTTPKPVVINPTSAPAATAQAGGTLVQPETDREALVTKVIDGDTIEIAGGMRVRYLGMDAPESSQSGKIEECFGYEAHKENQKLVEGEVVRLEKDISETDGRGQLLRYVWVGDLLINEFLIGQGFARAALQRPDFKYRLRLLEAQTEAKENEQGFWGACQYFGQPRKKCGCDRDYL